LPENLRAVFAFVRDAALDFSFVVGEEACGDGALGDVALFRIVGCSHD